MSNQKSILYKKISKGFTLIEILLVISLVLVVGFLGGIFPLQTITQMGVANSAEVARGVLWKAQNYALSGRGHSPWGVHYADSKIILFKGEGYDNRKAEDFIFDEETVINEKIQVTGFEDIIFEIPGGKPKKTASINFSWNESTKSLVMNSEGVVE